VNPRAHEWPGNWGEGVVASTARPPRIEAIDALCGLIIIVVALDSRDFFGDLSANPTDLSTTSAALFFTRWITHICAPGFFPLTES
jgi:uncharacterized membrane protein